MSKTLTLDDKLRGIEHNARRAARRDVAKAKGRITQGQPTAYVDGHFIEPVRQRTDLTSKGRR